MSTGTSLTAVLPVLTVGVLMCSLPAVTRPTLQFGVRVPRERAEAPVIRRERRAYYWRTAAIGACCAVVAVAGQLYFTTVYSGLMLIVHRSRPDTEAADPAGSVLRYRRFLAVITRALLTMAALADLGLLLIALPDWQVYRLSGVGRALPVLPFAAGVLVLGAVAARTGQGGARLNGNVRSLAPVAGTDRDDDRFWKAGLFYVNRDDPALVVGARFGVGWAPNLGNRTAWLFIAGTAAAWAGLAALGAAAGM